MGNGAGRSAEALAQAVIALAQVDTAIPSELADRLVGAVLDAAPEPVRLALAVLEGGEHATRRLIELAAKVLEEPRTVGAAEAAR